LQAVLFVICLLVALHEDTRPCRLWFVGALVGCHPILLQRPGRALLKSPQLQEHQNLFSITNPLAPKIPILTAESNGTHLTGLCSGDGTPLDSSFCTKVRRPDLSSGSEDQTPRPPLQPSHSSIVPTLCQPPLQQSHRLSPRSARSC
jgi:hypothetical protein